ncbi:MAG: Ig-like domain-containing protein [Muribaculaceae bacterium]|nr:Ig-like domain-containing protein [Muribaculaceae bacterium]
MKKYQRHILFFAGTIIAFIMVACASIGRPEGGPRDEMPPVFIKSNPTQGQTNVKSNKIEIFFDENLKVDDASNKVVISPVQKAMPSIIANGKKVSVELRDTLIPNTTYTIDFSDAIRDLNEGNPVDGFALDFSTGDSIDSLRISGMLFEARNLEPAQGMIVGVYSNLADSAISTLPLERISKTNQLGQFTIRGLKPGYYRIFALNDKNRDYHWDRSEDVAFYDVALSPSVEPIEVMDTLRASDGKDSLVSRQGVKFLPNNVLLTWFNEGYAAQYLKDYKRPERNRITFDFATKADTLPQITIINGKKAGLDIDEWALLNAGETLDTLEYWINDSVILAQDSILVAARYLRTDTNENLSWTTDTLKLFYKEPKKKKKKDKDEETDSIPEVKFLNWTLQAANPQDVNKPLRFLSSQPLAFIDNNGIKLSIKRDTIWESLPSPRILPDTSGYILKYTIPYEWQAGEKYKLEIDSASLIGIYNECNKPYKQEFSVRPIEDYVNLYFNVSGTELPIIVELLDGSDKVVATAPVIEGKASFNFLLPGKYFARAFIDNNNNGEYDTGKLLDKQQPEEVYYYPKIINAKKNWDIEQSWNIYEQPLDLQKPLQIKKNKPAQKKSGKNEQNQEEEEDEYDEFDDEYYTNPNRQNNSSGSSINRSGLRRNNGY